MVNSFCRLGLHTLNPLAKKVTSGSKGNRRGGPTKSKGTQKQRHSEKISRPNASFKQLPSHFYILNTAELKEHDL